MQEQVAQISLHLGLGNRRCFHAGVELQLFFEMTYLKRITALVYVFAQFLFHALDSRLKSLLKRLFHRNTCSDEIYKLAELSPPLSILSQNQVMHQCPRLGVEDALLVALVVVRRLLVNLKKRSQRQHFIFTKSEHMADYGTPQLDLLIVGDAEGAVILRKSFIEPGRRVSNIVIHQQMRVLMKYDSERTLVASQFSSEGNVVDVRSLLKITRGVLIGPKWPV